MNLAPSQFHRVNSIGNHMWHLFQGLIIFAVIASNIHWQWTPNGYIPAMLGCALAWLATAGLNRLRSTDGGISSHHPGQ